MCGIFNTLGCLTGFTEEEAEAELVKAHELVIDPVMLSYPVALALKISDMCHQAVGEQIRSDTEDEYRDFAQQFETIARQILDECPNEYVAERVLRGSKEPRLLDSQDMFWWIVNKVDQPQDFICSKNCQSYIEKVCTSIHI